MPESPFKHLIDDFKESFKKLPSAENPLNEKTIHANAKELAKTLYRAGIEHYEHFNRDKEMAIESAEKEYVENVESRWGSITNNPFSNTVSFNGHTWAHQLGKILKQYYLLNLQIKKLKDLESSINRIDRKAHTRALIFRASTTAAIALVLGGFYSIAGNNDNLYLPLQHKTVIHYYDGKPHSEPPPKDLYQKTRTEVKVTGSTKGTPWKLTSPLPKP